VYQIFCWVLIKNFKKIKIYGKRSIRRHTIAFDLWGGLKSKRHFARQKQGEAIAGRLAAGR